MQSDVCWLSLHAGLTNKLFQEISRTNHMMWALTLGTKRSNVDDTTTSLSCGSCGRARYRNGKHGNKFSRVWRDTVVRSIIWWIWLHTLLKDSVILRVMSSSLRRLLGRNNERIVVIAWIFEHLFLVCTKEASSPRSRRKEGSSWKGEYDCERKWKIFKIAPKIKARMMERGTTMVGYQPDKQRPNFFRMIISNQAIKREDLDFLIDEIVDIGESLE